MRNTQTNLQASQPSFAWKWHGKQMTSSCTLVPKKPGIYVIFRVTHNNGLEISRKYLYIGQSRNLWQRIRSHSIVREEKEDLRNYVLQHLHQIKCWYCVAPQKELNERERLLIKIFAPKFNRAHNKKGKIKT